MVKFQIQLSDASQIKQLYSITSKLPCNIDIGRGNTYYDGKSFLGLMAMTYGEPLWIILDSDDNSLMDRFSNWLIK